MSLDHFHIILIEPQESLNIGSVARAMQNLGFSHLHLVAPRGYDLRHEHLNFCRCGNGLLGQKSCVHSGMLHVCFAGYKVSRGNVAGDFQVPTICHVSYAS